MIIGRKDNWIRPPSGGLCSRDEPNTISQEGHIALLAEGESNAVLFYNHCPPDGGRAQASLPACLSIAFHLIPRAAPSSRIDGFKAGEIPTQNST